MLKKWLLPGGMIFAAALAFWAPRIGVAIGARCGSGLFIVLIFLICGWQADFREYRFDWKLINNFIFSGILTLFAAPIAAVAVAKLLKLDEMTAAGLIIILAMPPTLSSGIVMAANAGGNALAGMLFTVVFNFISVFTLPVILSWCLVEIESAEVNPFKMFLKLLLLVVLPFFIGALGRRRIPVRLPGWIGHISSCCVILLALSFFSMISAHLRHYPLKTLLILTAVCFLFRIALLTVLWFDGKLLKADRGVRIAMIFTTGSKTLTIALATVALLQLSGEAMVPCIIFYFIQVFLDSALSGHFCAGAERRRRHSDE